jgi:hypothetical protein
MRVLLCMLAALGVFAFACANSPTKYLVFVHFNTSVTQTDMDSVAGYLRDFDQGLDFLLQETFPPTGVARLRTNAKNFCATAEAELTSRSYIAGVDCRKAGDVTPVASPDAPVSSTP